MTSATITASELQLAAIIDSLKLTHAGTVVRSDGLLLTHKAPAAAVALDEALLTLDPFKRAEEVAKVLRRYRSLVAVPGPSDEHPVMLGIVVPWHTGPAGVRVPIALCGISIPERHVQASRDGTPRALAKLVAELLG